MTIHQHRCQCCGHEWDCDGIGKAAVCAVEKAAEINGNGPFCSLCLYGLMFVRTADNRHEDAYAHLTRVSTFEKASNTSERAAPCCASQIREASFSGKAHHPQKATTSAV